MLTVDQINNLRGSFDKLSRPIVEYILRDIAERIAAAGVITSSVKYKVWSAQQLGLSQKQILRYLKGQKALADINIDKLFRAAAQDAYVGDIRHLPTRGALPFDRQPAMQAIVAAAVKMAGADLQNITGSLGMIAPDGKCYPLAQAYRKTLDYMYTSVVTGAVDYHTAFATATRHLVADGIRTIDYASGTHRSVEAAVRGALMGGLGIMQEQISGQVHDDLGCNGWEISAHYCSAPDHEPIQGKQYADADYKSINDSLVRRISTLNCGHVATPIIIGVSEPQYSEAELDKIRKDNETGHTYRGRHYTGYEATQHQRAIERKIRVYSKKGIVYKAAGQADDVQRIDTILRQLRTEYKSFCKACGLREETERFYIGENTM